MKLQWIDLVITIPYLVIKLVIGWLLRKKKASMWMVTLCFVYGVKSIWIPWLWTSFNTIFMVMFLSKWLRRSNATSGAEWLATRFGTSGKGVKA